jgi:tetratricopeptide (TPR) repeat protein
VSALNKLAMALAYLGQLPEVENHLRDAEALARDVGDRHGLAELFTIRCMVCSMTAQLDEMVGHLDESVRLARELHLDENLAFGLTHRANTLGYLTRFDEMRSAAQEAEALFRQSGNLRYLAEILALPVTLGCLVAGELEAAAAAAEESVNIANRIGYAFPECLALEMLGGIALARGDFQQALDFFARSVDASTRTSYPFMQILGTASTSRAYTELGPTFVDDATRWQQRAQAMLEGPMGMVAAGFAWVDIGFSQLRLGEAAAAAETFTKGLTVPTTHGVLNRPLFLLGAALADLAQGNVDPAAGAVREARAIVDSAVMMHLSPVVGLAEGLVAAARGDDEVAVQHLVAAEASATRLGLRPVVYQARAEAAVALARLGRDRDAAEQKAAARSMIQEIGDLFEDPSLRSAYLDSTLPLV